MDLDREQLIQHLAAAALKYYRAEYKNGESNIELDHALSDCMTKIGVRGIYRGGLRSSVYGLLKSTIQYER